MKALNVFIEKNPKLFTALPLIDFGFPGITLTILGKSFKWYIIGYSKEQGGLPYLVAYMIAMIIGEIINFFLQRNITFRSEGNIIFQGLCYTVAFCIITCLVNSVNCIWIAVAQMIVPDWIYNVGTTVLNGGISIVIFFFVNKKIF